MKQIENEVYTKSYFEICIKISPKFQQFLSAGKNLNPPQMDGWMSREFSYHQMHALFTTVPPMKFEPLSLAFFVFKGASKKIHF